ncbi:hypothetical protein [Microbacterium sp.]|uniref:hypothetical protein n=1 Tax=Microbacterium sp. TaxID=51671 RepID=UPI003A91937D
MVFDTDALDAVDFDAAPVAVVLDAVLFAAPALGAVVSASAVFDAAVDVAEVVLVSVVSAEPASGAAVLDALRVVEADFAVALPAAVLPTAAVLLDADLATAAVLDAVSDADAAAAFFAAAVRAAPVAAVRPAAVVFAAAVSDVAFFAAAVFAAAVLAAVLLAAVLLTVVVLAAVLFAELAFVPAPFVPVPFAAALFVAVRRGVFFAEGSAPASAFASSAAGTAASAFTVAAGFRVEDARAGLFTASPAAAIPSPATLCGEVSSRWSPESSREAVTGTTVSRARKVSEPFDTRRNGIRTPMRILSVACENDHGSATASALPGVSQVASVPCSWHEEVSRR